MKRMSLKISAVFFLLILPNLGLSKIIKCSLDSYKALGNTKYGNVDNWIEGFLGVQFNINTKKNTVTTFQSKGAKGREIRISRTITNSKFTTYRYRRSVFDYSFRVYNNGLGKMNVQQNPVTKYIPVEGSGRCIEETKSKESVATDNTVKLAPQKTVKVSNLKSYFNKQKLLNRKLIQTNLQKLGMYRSSIDGLFGKRTLAALEEYNTQMLNGSDLSLNANITKLLASVLAFKPKVIPIPNVEVVPQPKQTSDEKADLFEKIKERFGLSFYGGFIHSDRLPKTLFFFSDIRKNDSFEFRKALRVHNIELIVLSSPGGSVNEGLQTAGIIHDKNLKTYIPKQSLYGSGNCASACSFMFFAGESRSAEGDLGVHQFYSGKASDEEEIGATQKRAQFTVSEIIGFLNEFETPPWVFERMFQQKEMYYFKESELLQLETEVSEETTAQYEKAEKFISDFRSAFVKIKD